MHGGLRAATKKADLALIVADDPAVAAGVFTLNVMCAAPVNYCREVLAQNDTCRAVRPVPASCSTCPKASVRLHASDYWKVSIEGISWHLGLDRPQVFMGTPQLWLQCS